MNVVDKLVIALGLDTSGVDKGVEQTKSKLLSGFSGIVGKIFAPLMAGFSFAKIFDSINGELKQLNTLSKVTHTNIEDLTAWSRAVESSGGNMDGFTQTLDTLNDSLTRISVTGSGRMKPFFEKMGLDATELAKKPVLDSMEAISKAIEGMDKTESANILRTMGFDSGSIKLLQSGEKGMKELIARQRELGVYTAKDAKAVAALNRGIKDITSAIKTLFIPIVMQIMNTASKVIKYLTNGVMFLRKNMDVLRGAVLLLAAVFSKQLLKAIIDLGRALLANPFGLFIIGLSAILLLLEDLWVYAKGGKTAFGNIWKNLGTPEEVMQGFKRVGTAITNLMKFVGNLFSGQGLGKTTKFLLILVGGIAALIVAIGWIPVAIAAAIGLLIAYWDEIEAMFNSVVEWFKQTGKSISDFFDSIGSAISGAMTNAANTAKRAWSSFITWLEEKWNWILGNIWKNLGTPEEVMQGFKRVGTAITNLMKFVGNLFSGQGLGKTTKFLLILVGGIAALIVAIGWIPVAIAAAIGLLIAYWDEIEAMFNSVVEWFKQTGKSISDFFDSIGSAISGAMTNAANTAKRAWSSFITWLEEKWNWIQSLLPSLSSIASKLPGIGNAISVASGGNGGNTSTVNNNQTITVNNHTPEASRAFAQSSGLVPQANGGIT